MGLKRKLEMAGEKCEADAGYRGEKNTVRTPDVFISRNDLRAKRRARKRHETVNRRVKQFNCLVQSFRHKKVEIHAKLFRAAVVCTQILFNCGEPPFHVKY